MKELSRSFPERIQSNPRHWNSYLQDESRHIAVSLYMGLDFKNWCPKVRGETTFLAGHSLVHWLPDPFHWSNLEVLQSGPSFLLISAFGQSFGHLKQSMSKVPPRWIAQRESAQADTSIRQLSSSFTSNLSWDQLSKKKWFRLRVHHVARRTQDLFSQPSEKKGQVYVILHCQGWPWCRGTADMAPSACSLQIEPERWKLQGNTATLGQPNFHSSFWWICLPPRALQVENEVSVVKSSTDMRANSKPWLILKLFRNSPKNPPQPEMSSWENGCSCDSLGPPSHHRIERPTDHLGDLVRLSCVDQHPMSKN